MSSNILLHAFVDESGTASSENGTHFLVVAVLATSQPRALELPIRRALRKYGRLLGSGELKASRIKESANVKLLQEIAEKSIQIIATIVDQDEILTPPDNAEEIYRFAVSTAIHRLVESHPKVQIVLDRRYTNQNLRNELERFIREEIQDLPRTVVLIRQEESHVHKELQAADAVSWAFFQKYERGNSSFYDIIASKVIVEEVIRKKNWEDD